MGGAGPRRGLIAECGRLVPNGTTDVLRVLSPDAVLLQRGINRHKPRPSAVRTRATAFAPVRTTAVA
ncbi:hypothetical protein [Cryptosporangium sp. NPDC051539]|uniref:hypothetical protein n=1 Tax=Cryptosporangium sp. NPDC051539 TaxID=3363962 RepID=UPI0037AFD456